MTTQEFSNTFDTLLNSYSTQAVFGEAASINDIVLDEYEKSVLLTQAQDMLLKEYFEKQNAAGQGMDDSSRRQIDFSSLITVKSTKDEDDPITENVLIPKYDDRSTIYNMPKNVLIILNEHIKIGDKHYVVVPINYKEYDRNMSKAYFQPLKNQAWRLFQGTSDGSNVNVQSEIISINGNNITSYTVRYIRRPRPIVLTDLEDSGLDIDGVTVVQECELNPIMHMDILTRAVELAYNTRGRVSTPTQNK